MKKAYIALDVGGTSISASVVSDDGRFLTEVKDYEAHSNLSPNEIFDNIASIINEQFSIAGDNICGVGIAFPGPFDYENGISLMREIGKFDNIYGMNLRDELIKRLIFKTDIRFYNDADLYTIGECAFGVGKPYRRCMCVCIGTGIGSGFYADGKLVREGDGVPENGWIYNTPYLSGIADEYLSGTWLKKALYSEPKLSEIKNVKELSEAARAGNTYAKQIFDKFAHMLCEVLVPFAVSFKAECLVFGGNVSRSSELFDFLIKEKLSKYNIEVKASENFAKNTLLACSKLFN